MRFVRSAQHLVCQIQSLSDKPSRDLALGCASSVKLHPNESRYCKLQMLLSVRRSRNYPTSAKTCTSILQFSCPSGQLASWATGAPTKTQLSLKHLRPETS